MFAAAGDDEAQSMLPALAQQIEQGAIQITMPPMEFVDRRRVEVEHRIEEVVGNFGALIGGDRDALGGEFPTFTFDLVAALAPEGVQVVVERRPVAIDPLKLMPGAPFESDLGEFLDLVGGAEVHMDRREGSFLAEDAATSIQVPARRADGRRRGVTAVARRWLA